MNFKLGTLANNPDLIPTLVEWFESERPDHDRATAAFWEERAQESLPMALVLYDDDTPIGTVSLTESAIDARSDLSPWVSSLYVVPEHRGKGVDELLVHAAARVAWGSGLEKIYAATSEAADLFEGVGFTEIDTAVQGDEEVVVLELERPPEPPSFYELVGGEEKVRELVDRFYDLMDELPEASAVREMHARSLRSSRDKLFEFLSGWMGGPNLYIEKRGHPRLRMRHMPFAIGTEARDQWLLCMDRALDETIDDEKVRGQLKDSFARIADHMRNRRGP